MPPPDDRTRLLHMMEAAEEAMEFVRGKSREDLSENRQLSLALVRLIEIIGEAASRVGSETREQFPTVPWPDVISMRNRLIHAYFDVDLDRVWTTVNRDLPSLVNLLQPHLETSADEAEPGP